MTTHNGTADSMPRILHVSQPVSEGVAQVLIPLAQHQSQSGWDVHIACPPQGWLPERLDNTAITLHSWSASRSPGPSSFTEARKLQQLIRQIQPDVVHLHSSKAGLAGRLIPRDLIPRQGWSSRPITVFQPHAWSFQADHGPVGQISALWERLAMRFTDLLIAVSQDELDEGRRHRVTPRYSVVVPNGIDVQRFVPQDRAQARAALDLPDDGPIAVCLGRLATQKGQDILLDVWPQVRRAVPNARLLLVGDGPDRHILQARLSAGVEMVGTTDRPEDYLAASDVVIVPSRWEGMALVPLEAMACERPVVAFGVAGMAESIGDAGAVVPTGDIAGLTREVIARLADPEQAHREGQRGRARAVTLHDRDRAIEVTDRTIRSMLSARTAARRSA